MVCFAKNIWPVKTVGVPVVKYKAYPVIKEASCDRCGVEVTEKVRRERMG